MSWFRHARRGAAYEFGRRLWGWFFALEIISYTFRRVLPVVLILAAVAVSGWLAVRTSAWWLPRLTALAVLAAVLTVAIGLARRYRWEIRSGLPRTVIAAGVVALAGVLGTAVYWLR